ncbi:GNAT family N-acetyltransferase [Streptomyces specialis]|uniref:GNAT family N-acetyltransferase n=1 Tax=Streptomyces specialis TaxID=498367 RepID=UPI00073F208D|nr:GNAT family N-acetyltransferase [Streptomyces specialis]
MRTVRLAAGELPRLAELVVDAVESGASVGFLRPFTAGEAAAWWAGHAAAVAAGRMAVWAAVDGDGRWIGTVSLVFEQKPTGRHRAEIVKLLVHSAARRRGVARALLAVAERAAADAGVTLLMLDTEKDSGAERLYRSEGWIKFGEVPGHAADPDGVPRPTSFYRKDLPAAVAP